MCKPGVHDLLKQFEAQCANGCLPAACLPARRCNLAMACKDFCRASKQYPSIWWGCTELDLKVDTAAKADSLVRFSWGVYHAYTEDLCVPKLRIATSYSISASIRNTIVYNMAAVTRNVETLELFLQWSHNFSTETLNILRQLKRLTITAHDITLA